jgi:hypothetical protein
METVLPRAIGPPLGHPGRSLRCPRPPRTLRSRRARPDTHERPLLCGRRQRQLLCSRGAPAAEGVQEDLQACVTPAQARQSGSGMGSVTSGASWLGSARLGKGEGEKGEGEAYLLTLLTRCRPLKENGAFGMSLVRLRRPRVPCGGVESCVNVTDSLMARPNGSSAPATARQNGFQLPLLLNLFCTRGVPWPAV